VVNATDLDPSNLGSTPLIPVRVVGGGRNDIWPKLLTCDGIKVPPILVGTSQPSNDGVSDIKFRRWVDDRKGTQTVKKSCTSNPRR